MELGFVGLYRRFFKQFSRIAHPLHEVVQQGGPCKKKGWLNKKSTPFHWREHQQQALEELVRLVTTAPVLGFADFSQPFKLYTDASFDGLGAVLYQNQDGEDWVIATPVDVSAGPSGITQYTSWNSCP